MVRLLTYVEVIMVMAKTKTRLKLVGHKIK